MFFACGIYVWCVVVRVTCFLTQNFDFSREGTFFVFYAPHNVFGAGGGGRKGEDLMPKTSIQLPYPGH